MVMRQVDMEHVWWFLGRCWGNASLSWGVIMIVSLVGKGRNYKNRITSIMGRSVLIPAAPSLYGCSH